VSAVYALGVVPARGGSKGLPGKNLLALHGEPLIVHTIRAARAASSLGRLIVSTDDEAIAAVARGAGAEVILRPSELATDESPTEDALIHVLDTLEQQRAPAPDYVVTLEPTSPLRTAALIDRCGAEAVGRGAGAARRAPAAPAKATVVPRVEHGVRHARRALACNALGARASSGGGGRA